MSDQPDENGAAAAADRLLDPSHWILCGQEALQKDQPQEAIEACRRAILLLPDMEQLYRLMLDAADRLGDGSGASLAVRELVHLIPGDGPLVVRHAEALLAGGQTDLALLHLQSIIRQEPGALWPYVIALASAGRYIELVACQPLLDAWAHPPPMPFGPYIHLALAKLAISLDRPEIQRVLARLENSAGWLQPTRILDRLRQVIGDRQPFSFMQLDEAECRFLCYGSPRVHLVLRPHEASTMADASWQAWTGETIVSAGQTRIALLAQDVLLAFEKADLCGIADTEMMALDHYHFGFLGEVQRLVLREGGQHYASSRVLPILHQIYPFFHELLVDQPFLGMVSSHHGLAERLGRFVNIDEIVSYIVPDFQTMTATALIDWHQQHLATLTIPFTGAVFLISAGLLGKLWCARVRALGGIAIEIGTLAESWAQQYSH